MVSVELRAVHNLLDPGGQGGDCSQDKSLNDAGALKVQTVEHHFAEGGKKAWLVVVGCWCTAFVSMGYINSFGVYETYYHQTLLSGYSVSAISWIGSIQAFAQFSTTLISGPVTDRYGAQSVIWPCSVILVIGMMLTSLCTKFYQFLLCQGVLLGISSGMIFAPAMTVVGHYFFKRRAVAMALAATGSPVGGIIYPVIMTSCLQNPNIGFPWGQRVCGFLSFGLLFVAAATIRPLPLRRRGNFILLNAFRKPAYSFQVAALFMVVLGIWTPYFYIAEYGLAHGMAPGLASYLFALLNGGSFLGRLVGGVLADHLGQFNVVMFACYTSGILLFCWLKIYTTAGLIVLSLLFGASSGIIIALMMSTVAHTAEHPNEIGTYIGMSTFVVGFAGLGGTPITGALIDTHHEYARGITFSASVTMAGAIIFTVARYTYARYRLFA